MAGHSKFKNIMHRKGAQDKKRAAQFSKLSREITVAAKMGMPDPDMNPRLRAAVNAARAQSMPKDNIQRAIDKASKGDAENYEEVRYEGYGPGGVALIVEALTSALAGYGRADGETNWGASVFLQLIDPNAFGGGDAFKRELGWFVDSCRTAPVAPGNPPVRIPGERALALRKRQREDGVALHPEIMPALAKIAAETGIVPPKPRGG